MLLSIWPITDASGLKASSHGVSTAAKLPRNFASRKSILEKRPDGTRGNRKSEMSSHMIATSKDSKIFHGIVKPITIEMMDNFISMKSSSENTFSYKDVFVTELTTGGSTDFAILALIVPIVNPMASNRIIPATLAGTEGVPSSHLRGWLSEDFATMLTFESRYLNMSHRREIISNETTVN